MQIDMVHSSRRLRVRRRVLRSFAAWLASRLAARTPRRRWENVCLILLDDEGMAAANRACFRRDRPTDVISLTYRPAGREGGWRGEVLVNSERARQEGRRRPGGAARELALYLAHGFDHLSGADDNTPRRRAAMRRRETRWLSDSRQTWKGLLA